MPEGLFGHVLERDDPDGLEVCCLHFYCFDKLVGEFLFHSSEDKVGGVGERFL